MMQRLPGFRSQKNGSKLLMVLVTGLIVLVVLGAIMFIRTLWKRSRKEETPWLIVPKGDGTFKVMERIKEEKETFQPDIDRDQIGDGFSQRVMYIRNHMSLLDQSLSGYDFFEKGECDDSNCRTVDLTKNEDAFSFLNEFYKEVSEASRDSIESVPGVQLLFDISNVVNLDPLTIRVPNSLQAGEDGYVDMLVGYGKGHFPLTTGYQWLLYMRKHEGKPLPRPDKQYNYAVEASN